MNFPTSPKEKESNYIIVDEKIIGIWDLINLGNKGGIINLTNNFAIESVKQDSKWSKICVRQYGLNKPKENQQFHAVKKVKDDKQLNELKEKIKVLEKNSKTLDQENKQLIEELSKYKVSTKTTLKQDTVYEL